MCQKFFWNESYINFYIINIISNFFLSFSKQQAIFKENNLVIECNKETVDYLDITLNLNNGTFKSYHKTATSSNMRNRTILQEQNRIDFQVLTCQQAYARKKKKRLKKDWHQKKMSMHCDFIVCYIIWFRMQYLFINFQLIMVGVKL